MFKEKLARSFTFSCDSEFVNNRIQNAVAAAHAQLTKISWKQGKFEWVLLILK